MLSSKIGHRLDRYLIKVFRFLFDKKVNPNLLTLLGLLVTFVGALLFAINRQRLAGLCLLTAGLFDMLDGAVARNCHRTTRFGSFLDSVIDRYSDMIFLTGIIIYFSYQKEISYIIVSCLALIGTILVSYSRAKAETLHLKCNVGLMERPERIILLTLGILAGQVKLTLIVLAILTHFTVLQRIHYAWRTLPAMEHVSAEDDSTPFDEISVSEK